MHFILECEHFFSFDVLNCCRILVHTRQSFETYIVEYNIWSPR